ncbi:hypothetical protein RM572_05945 [Streptomyces sp. DSM 42041]|uniref:Helix-turn-helix domain-containing protein n=1 Tax=Streptomyces hazeniae TaxID=3075538 RepID=A0ABU2NP02_9ACTN|nr:hypothetical protein [Streptomyces sp. DSM 42041]MDT0378321.1 hypothetical protein [Streptomyces sp. DSM 42041]
MLRHAIAPARAFAQIPNAILRHPRLSSDAKTLLNWQLSLPPGDRQCLSDTARRAGIGKCAFQNAKRQLRDEGYLHEWRTQTGGGRFVTVQLVSNAPLSTKEALAARDGLQPAPGGARLAEARPSDGTPAAGEPTGQAVGRQPQENTGKKTHQPASSAPERAAEVTTEPPHDQAEPAATNSGAQRSEESSTRLLDAEAFLHSLGRDDPRLSLPRHTARHLAPLAVAWLDTGLPRDQLRHALSQGLAGARSTVALLRWRLANALPDVPPPPPSGPRPRARLSGMRECRTRHTQPRLFTPAPGSDNDLCPDCRAAAAKAAGDGPEPLDAPGFAAFLSARAVKRTQGRAR